MDPRFSVGQQKVVSETHMDFIVGLKARKIFWATTKGAGKVPIPSVPLPKTRVIIYDDL